MSVPDYCLRRDAPGNRAADIVLKPVSFQHFADRFVQIADRAVVGVTSHRFRNNFRHGQIQVMGGNRWIAAGCEAFYLKACSLSVLLRNPILLAKTDNTVAAVVDDDIGQLRNRFRGFFELCPDSSRFFFKYFKS